MQLDLTACVSWLLQVPDALASQIVNVTATGQSYIAFNFKNVTDTDTFQVNLQFPAFVV